MNLMGDLQYKFILHTELLNTSRFIDFRQFKCYTNNSPRKHPGYTALMQIVENEYLFLELSSVYRSMIET